jgi:hypothetical protein
MSLSAQHYDCIVGALEINGIRLDLSTSGCMIPANRLAEMMSQKPYGNHIWIAQRSRDETLPEIDRNAEKRRFSRGWFTLEQGSAAFGYNRVMTGCRIF